MSLRHRPAASPVGAELRILLRLAAPIAFAQAGLALMGLIDTAVVGRLGAAPLGAIGLANGLFFAVAVMGIGAMMGMDPLLAQAFGAADGRRARELLWQALWLSGAVTIVLSLPIALLPLFLKPFGIEGPVARDASWFIWLRLPGLWPTLAFVGLRSYLQAAHVVRALVVATVVANLANLVLDVLFVFGRGPIPAMGAPGAGIATSLCSFVMCAIMAQAAARLQPGLRVSRKLHLPDLRRALQVGLPVGLQMGAEVSVFALVGLFAGKLGARSLAAHQVAIALASFTFCAAVGIGNAGSVRVGWAVGAGDTPGARRSGLMALALGTGVMGCSALLFACAPGPLAHLLSDQPEVIAATIPLLGVCAFFQISDGVQAVGAGILRGAGDTRYPFIANLVGHYLIGLPLALFLGFRRNGGVLGLWWGLSAGLTAVAILLLARFVRLSSRKIIPLESHPGH